MNRWESIEILTAVVEAGSFSAAAQRLNVSKSHVSRAVSWLENRLGVQLLSRTTRRLALTEIGEAYYRRCREIVGSLEEADRAVMDLQATPRGTLKMTVPSGFGEHYVAPAAVAFARAHPQLSIDMDFTNRTVDLVAEGYDLAIRAGVLKDSSLIVRRIVERRLHICGSRDYFSRYGKPDSIDALKRHNCLAGSLPTWRFRQAGGHVADIRVEGSWRSNNGYALLEAARRGLGLVQLPAFYLQDDFCRGSLESVLRQYQPTDTAMWAVYPGNRHLSPKVKMFVDYLVETITSN